jgi:Holliday junction resolvase RusA-like endonuclease
VSDSHELVIHLPFLPPSENRIRVHRRQGGQVYSKEARDFETLFGRHVLEHNFNDIADFVAGHRHWHIYAVTMRFHFETLVNSGWAKKQAKTLYKKTDVGNRRKLIEDCLSRALGVIDDSLFFDLRLVKAMSPTPGVTITVQRITDLDEYGLPDA